MNLHVNDVDDTVCTEYRLTNAACGEFAVPLYPPHTSFGFPIQGEVQPELGIPYVPMPTALEVAEVCMDAELTLWEFRIALPQTQVVPE
jgi:hypothetical protein